MLAVDTNTAVHDTNVTVHNTQHRLSQQGHKLDGMDSRLSDAVEFLRKLNSGSGAGAGEEARILKQMIDYSKKMEQQALDMREIILERVSSASVTTSDMHYPLSLYGWGQEMEFHRINTEYPGLRVSSCRRRLVFCRPG